MPASARRTVLLLFLLGLSARVAWGLATGLSGAPVEDERGYALLARSLADGRGLELTLPSEFADVPPRTSFRAPLVPVLLAPLAALGLGDAAFRVAAIFAGAAAAPLAWLALRRTRLGAFAVWPAAALAVWPASIHLSTRILSEPFAGALLLGALAVPAADGGARAGILRGAASGALAGLAVLARPATLPAALAVALFRGGWRFAAAHVALVLLVLVPWVALNASEHGRPLLTTNTGATLLGGNCEASLAAAHPGKWVEPRAAWGDAPDPPDLGIWGWSRLTEEESDRRFTGRALAFAADRPADAARLVAWKAVRFLDPDPTSVKEDAAAKRLAGWASFLPVLLLAVPGAWIARSPGSGLGPWAMLLAGTFATALVFYADTRLRNPADPAFLAFAGVAFHAFLARRAPSAAADGGNDRT